jgi:hypothetical protein
MRRSLVFGLFLSLSVLVVFGCGGGGGGGGSNTQPINNSQPTLVTVKVATTGTLPANTTIGGINAIVFASPSAGLTISDSDVTLSGVGVGSTFLPNTTNVSAVVIGQITTNGFQVGEFVTLKYHVAAGTFPTAGNFSVALTGSGVIGTNGAPILGIGVTIQSVTVQ